MRLPYPYLITKISCKLLRVRSDPHQHHCGDVCGSLMTIEKRHKPRVERLLRKRSPLPVENTKKILILKGHHTSQVINDVLRDMGRVTKPHNKVLNRKNEILPFDDTNSLEFLCEKNDCSLFAVGSHTKKRPNNLILGRHHNWHLLDMVEFGVEDFESLDNFAGQAKAVGSKPVFAFLGDQWEQDSNYTRIMNLLIDTFRGDKLERLSLKGLDHVITCSVCDGKIYFRPFSIHFKKGVGRIPLVDLHPMGPNMNLTVRRSNFAQEDMWKAACRTPKGLVPTTKKNIKRTALGEKVGRIHMKKQNLDKMKIRRVDALRNQRHHGEE